MKRLKDIEDKSGEQLKMTENKKDNQLGIKSVTHILDEELSQEVKNVLVRFSYQEKIIEYTKLDFRRNNGLEFYFDDYRSLKELFKAIYYRNLPTDKAERIQDEYQVQLATLEKHRPRNPDYVIKRENLLSNAKKFYDGREIITKAFKDKIFPLSLEEGLSEFAGRDEDEDKDRFYTPKEVTPRTEIPDFGIREMFEDEEETPRDIPDLKTEESAAQGRKQKGHGLKILTQQQTLNKLPISLSRLKARNNS